MQPHQSSPPIVESVALWRSDNDVGNGPATSSSEHEAFLLLAYVFSYPGQRMGNEATVQLKRPSAETWTIAKGGLVAPTGICVRAVHRDGRLTASDRLVASTGIGPHARLGLSWWNRLTA
ncbi:hypothetical protein KXX44_008673 [Aspergillus fumigatus]|nr:hypothetical protein KXX44_008673 [Aspergillus fumigatus]KAH1630184.1 hypothetical protein KXX39_002795 [Aspergillus fumigatus]KAH2980432.1 hypothetical protein KXV25_003197 [Aspergillus fumigatus]KAH3494932.1 hypothetical protein KXW24_002787 [Aspergillus fumigatus]